MTETQNLAAAPAPAAPTTLTTALEQRVAKLESDVSTLAGDAKTWYEKHLPLLGIVAGALLGGCLVKLLHL